MALTNASRQAFFTERLLLPDNVAGIVNDTNCRSFLRYIECGKGRH
jgi:hypothetical protein